MLLSTLLCLTPDLFPSGPYSSYEGSPVSRGILQPDMWGVKPASDRWDWDGLRADIAQHGIRNSLLVAPMPTASTSQVGTCCIHLSAHISAHSSVLDHLQGASKLP